jgi:hypothetical protein
MLPWQKAAKWFSRFSDGATFEELLAAYVKNGFVWSSPLSFLLFRPVFWDGKDIFTKTDTWNAWFVHLAAGDISDFHKRFPFPLEHVVFQRHGKQQFHAYPFKILASKIHGFLHS